MLVGLILCPLECLGIKHISSFSSEANKISSEGFPHGVLIFFHLDFFLLELEANYGFKKTYKINT